MTATDTVKLRAIKVVTTDTLEQGSQTATKKKFVTRTRTFSEAHCLIQKFSPITLKNCITKTTITKLSLVFSSDSVKIPEHFKLVHNYCLTHNF